MISVVGDDSYRHNNQIGSLSFSLSVTIQSSPTTLTLLRRHRRRRRCRCCHRPMMMMSRQMKTMRKPLPCLPALLAL